MGSLLKEEYLKRYLSKDELKSSNRKERKKKLKSARNTKGATVKVMTYDTDIPSPPKREEPLSDEVDEPPVSCEIQDDRPIQGHSAKHWKKVVDSGQAESTVKNLEGRPGMMHQRSPINDSPDLSPPRRRQRHDSPDLSPPRPRQRHDSPDMSPPRQRQRHDSPDLSPPRQRPNHNSPDLSPPRRRQRHDSPDLSPPRPSRQRHDSPDMSPPRQRQRHDSPDLSPPRQRTNSPDASPPRRRHDPQPPKDKSRTDYVGLVTASQVALQAQQRRIEEKERFLSIDAQLQGKGAETVVRDKATGARLDMKLEKLKKKEAENRAMEEEESRLAWGKGTVQTQEKQQKMEDDLREMAKPFARGRDDEDLDRYLRSQSRAGDPMAHLVKKKKSKIPVYEGNYAPNRFNIRPGFRWDGVDRSNGFEKKFFERQAAATAQQNEAYGWSIEDM